MKRAALLLILGISGVQAEVTDSANNGFTTVNEVVIDTTIERAWEAATSEIAAWWHPDHTISGDASRLSISATPMGCFCESMGDDAGVVHMTVTTSTPYSLLRLTGGLGPLGLMGVDGNMTWEFYKDDAGVRVRFAYAVGGYLDGGLDAIAEPVDFVIGEALTRLATYLETGDPVG